MSFAPARDGMTPAQHRQWAAIERRMVELNRGKCNTSGFAARAEMHERMAMELDDTKPIDIAPSFCKCGHPDSCHPNGGHCDGIIEGFNGEYYQYNCVCETFRCS